ncbi:MAG: NifB/NifX family molybdenum-iron cluster-binding protein [Calditrichia bacterium]
MKFAFSAENQELFSKVGQSFSSSKYYIILDSTEQMQYHCLHNTFLQKEDFGLSAARMLKNNGINVVITGKCNREVYDYFENHGIRVYTGFTGNILLIIKKFMNLQLRLGSRAGFDAEPREALN